MSLYNVTWKPDILITPDGLEASEYVITLRKKINLRSFDKMIRTIDDGLLNLESSKSSKLIWTKFGALLGHKSIEPHKDINHFWDVLIKHFGDDKLVYKLGGTLLRWRISIKEDTWLLWIEEKDEVDPDTGKKITVSQYWVDNDYTPQLKKDKDLSPSLEQIEMLKNKKW